MRDRLELRDLDEWRDFSVWDWVKSGGAILWVIVFVPLLLFVSYWTFMRATDWLF